MTLHLTFLHGFVPSYPVGLDLAWWSLTPEIVFYALLPLLVLKFQKFSQRVAISGVLLLISLATRLLQTYDAFSLLPLFSSNPLGQERMAYFPTATLYLFLVGMLLRMMVERCAQSGSREPGRRQLFMASALTLVPIAVLVVLPYLTFRLDETERYSAVSLAEAMVILTFASALLSSPILRPILRSRLLAFFGKTSYSLFVLHDQVLTARFIASDLL